MILDRIGYQKLFSLPNYENEKVIIEGQLEAGDDIQECLLQLKKAAEKFHKDNNPQLEYGEITKLQVGEYPPYQSTMPTVLPSLDRKAIEKLEILIDNAESLVELEKYESEAERLNLMTHYNSKQLKIVNGTQNQ